MKKLSRGILLSIEGIDGSGKSTLLANMARAFNAAELPVVLTHEPGNTPLGKTLRTLLQERTVPVTAKAEFLLFATDRAQHFQELIIPALQDNKLILSDRMADSSLVYQGYGRGLPLDMISSVNSWAMEGIQPDLTIYVRIPPAVAYERFKQRKKLTVFEQEKETFFTKLVTGFDTIFAQRTNVIHLDGQRPPDELTNQAVSTITEWLITHKILT
jgi:dTMP kinase